MYIGDNQLNDHGENFSKTAKIVSISNLFLPRHSNYISFMQAVGNSQNSNLNVLFSCDTFLGRCQCESLYFQTM